MNSLKLTIYCLFITVIFSCNKNIIFKNKSIDTPCKELIQNLIDHTARIDDNYVDYIVLNTKKTKKEEYLEFADRMMKGWSKDANECLANFNKKDIVKQFGKPNSTRSRENDWYYIYTFGPDCPCTSCSPRNLFDECNFINFRFNDIGQLNYLYVDLNGMQWE